MLNGLLSLLLTGATLTGVADDQAPKPKIDVSAQIYMPDGKASSALRRVELGNDPTVLYVYTGKTLCEAQTVSTEKPLVAGNGWRVELSRWVAGPLNVKGAASGQTLSAKWQRLWEGGKAVSNGTRGSVELDLHPDSAVPLDTIDGAGRRAAQAALARLQQWKLGQPIPALAANDQRVLSASRAIESTEKIIESLQPANIYQQQNPSPANRDNQIASMRADIRSQEVALITRIREIAEAASKNQTTIPIPLVDGCAALSMNLQVEAATPTPRQTFELEFWLVHKDPAGKETTQRQVVRVGSTNPEFYFDDLHISTDRGQVTVEIFGSTGSLTLNPDGSVFFNIGVHRRYVTTSPAYPWKTKEGQNSYGGNWLAGEVAALQLPPLPADDGVLVGHRFSLRVRVKVLQ